MAQHGHHGGHGQGHGHSAGHKRGGIHRDWRFWTAVVLMLAAMAVYVLSFDESLEPGGQISPEVPAAAE